MAASCALARPTGSALRESSFGFSLSAMRESQLTFLEFFAGGGMARAGLGKSWRCLFANDFDAMKVATYVRNYGDEDIKLEDVAKLTLDDLPAEPSDLAWASFPCQDLSLAGEYRGLGRERDGAPTRSGSFLAILEAYARASGGETLAARHCSGERVRLPHVPRGKGFRRHRLGAFQFRIPVRRDRHQRISFCSPITPAGVFHRD